jgi:signal transduction histidine kinase
VLLDDVHENYPQFPDDIHGWLTIPLKVHGSLIGFISLDSHERGHFTERDAELALTYANQAAIALENSRLFTELQAELSLKEKLIHELENKNAELERFTYTVSHDLRSPLVTIQGFLGYLELDMKAGNISSFHNDMGRITNATRRMDTLLKDLLELSRVGRLMNKPRDVPFGELVHEALEIVHGRLEKLGIMLQIRPDLPVVHVDKPRLIEVLQNLLDNAAKYMGDQKEPFIEIGMSGHNDSGDPIFFVRDNGMGIAPEYHERIFGLFDKLDAASEGTGVGLALVKRIIEFHGGRIWVESEPGKGSTFFFTLENVKKDS